MPRTKVAKKRRATQERNLINNDTVLEPSKKKDLNEKMQELQQVIDSSISRLELEKDRFVMEVNQVFKEIQIQLVDGGMSTMPLKELDIMLLTNEKNKATVANEANVFSKPKPIRVIRKRSNSCTSRSSKTQGSSARSASCDRPRRNLVLSASKMRTPVNQNAPVAAVTPKVNPNQPVSVLRRPRQGEFALSMCGSPLMVSGITYDDCVSVTIPLADGRVMSILPNEGIDAANLSLDDVTRRQLMKLKSNLTKCLQQW